MTLREKQRLRRIIEGNATAYRDARRTLMLHVLRGTANGEAIEKARWEASYAAISIAEAAATLEEHVDADES